MTSHTTLKSVLEAETDKLLGCIHCGMCLPVCPTYVQLGNENDSPRGRIYLMRAVAEGRLDPASDSFARHIDLCLGCRACETACPAGVRYGFLLEAAREVIIAHEPKGRSGFKQRMLGHALKHIFPHPGRLRIVFAILRFLRRSSIIKLAQREGLIRGISPEAEFALSLLLSTEPSGKPISEVQLRQSKPANPAVPTARSVTVFTGCVMEGLFKQANDATARVLFANGARLAPLETQVCCGALHAHSGDIATSRELAKRNIDAFEKAGQDSTIIVNAAGCGAMLKEYGELLKHDSSYAERALAFSARVRDISEYLSTTGIRRGSELKTTVTYDAPCHLYHAQRVTTAPQQVLSAIPGLEYRPLEGMQDCCGGAGIYNLTEPEMSERLLADKIAKVKATGAEVLVTANPGCHMQIGAGISRFEAECQVVHVVEMLDESYRRAGFYDSQP